jgi:hypothetical protein
VVEALRYKPEGRGINSRLCRSDFSLTYSFRSHYGPGVDLASNRNECPGLSDSKQLCRAYCEIYIL